jgi:hypothetical protein
VLPQLLCLPIAGVVSRQRQPLIYPLMRLGNTGTNKAIPLSILYSASGFSPDIIIYNTLETPATLRITPIFCSDISQSAAVLMKFFAVAFLRDFDGSCLIGFTPTCLLTKETVL